MRTRFVIAASIAASLLALAGPEAEARSGTSRLVRGRLVATDDDSDAHGKFAIVVKTRGDRVREGLLVNAWRLDVPDDGSYHVFLVSADGNTEADFGKPRLSSRGRARLKFDSRRDDYPTDAEPLSDFAGGTVEIRLGDDVVLSGDIPDFLGVDDDNGRGSGARTRAWAQVRLRHTRDAKKAKGILWCLYVNKPAGTVEALGVDCLGLGSARDEFTVVAIDDDDEETVIGTMKARTRLGIAVLKLTSRRDDDLPEGGVLGLAGQAIEIRAEDDTVLMTGTFPTLTDE